MMASKVSGHVSARNTIRRSGWDPPRCFWDVLWLKNVNAFYMYRVWYTSSSIFFWWNIEQLAWRLTGVLFISLKPNSEAGADDMAGEWKHEQTESLFSPECVNGNISRLSFPTFELTLIPINLNIVSDRYRSALQLRYRVPNWQNELG